MVNSLLTVGVFCFLPTATQVCSSGGAYQTSSNGRAAGEYAVSRTRSDPRSRALRWSPAPQGVEGRYHTSPSYNGGVSVARTGERGAFGRGERIAADSTALATIGMEKGLWRPEDIPWIFKTIARQCKDPRDQWLFLSTCAANGLNPLKRELHAIARKDRPPNGEPYTVMTYVTSFHVFVSRSRQAGFVVNGMDVCEGDEFEGWDGVSNRPVKHIVGKKKRAKVVGAWANALSLKSHTIVAGKYWEIGELVQKGPNPLRETMPGHFAWKTAVCRIGRLIAPDLSSMYSMEEFGYTTGTPGDDLPAIAGEVIDGAASTEDQLASQGAEGAIDVDYTVGDGNGDDKKGDDTDEGSEPLPPEEQTVTFAQRRDILKALAKQGATARPDIEVKLTKLLGREIKDTKKLTGADYARLVEPLSIGGE